MTRLHSVQILLYATTTLPVLRTFKYNSDFKNLLPESLFQTTKIILNHTIVINILQNTQFQDRYKEPLKSRFSM